jgi:membrane protease YdiL (CAAX protease family)
MDDTVPGLLTTLAIDLLIFCILFTLFSYYRKLRSAPVEVEIPNVTIKKPYFQESTTPLWPLIKKVYSVSNIQLIENLSFTSYIFMELHRHILIGLALMTLVGFSILIPIYSLGHDGESDDLSKISITNILLNENYMIAPCFMIFFFSIVLYYISYLYSKNCKKEEVNVRDI